MKIRASCVKGMYGHHTWLPVYDGDWTLIALICEKCDEPARPVRYPYKDE